MRRSRRVSQSECTEGFHWGSSVLGYFMALGSIGSVFGFGLRFLGPWASEVSASWQPRRVSVPWVEVVIARAPLVLTHCQAWVANPGGVISSQRITTTVKSFSSTSWKLDRTCPDDFRIRRSTASNARALHSADLMCTGDAAEYEQDGLGRDRALLEQVEHERHRPNLGLQCPGFGEVKPEASHL